VVRLAFPFWRVHFMDAIYCAASTALRQEMANELELTLSNYKSVSLKCLQQRKGLDSLR